MRGFAVLLVCLMSVGACLVASPVVLPHDGGDRSCLIAPSDPPQVAVKIFRRRSCSGGRCG